MERTFRNVDAFWIPEYSLFVARLRGTVSLSDVDEWRGLVKNELAAIPAGRRFKLIADLTDYAPAEGEASPTHRTMREVIPTVLIHHGFRPGYLGLFPEVVVELSTTNGRVVTAAAHVHHNETKISEYNKRFAGPRERFFLDFQSATDWILEIPAETAQSA